MTTDFFTCLWDRIIPSSPPPANTHTQDFLTLCFPSHNFFSLKSSMPPLCLPKSFLSSTVCSKSVSSMMFLSPARKYFTNTIFKSPFSDPYPDLLYVIYYCLENILNPMGIDSMSYLSYNPEILSLSKYLLSNYVPGTVQSTRDASVSKQSKISTLLKLSFWSNRILVEWLCLRGVQQRFICKEEAEKKTREEGREE